MPRSCTTYACHMLMSMLIYDTLDVVPGFLCFKFCFTLCLTAYAYVARESQARLRRLRN